MKIPREFRYLVSLIDYRLNNLDGLEIPDMPDVETWDLPIKKFILEKEIDKETALLLLMGLAPYVVPELIDSEIQNKLKTAGDFPELGGTRGKNFRGFMPTGQTAVFLLAGGNWKKRIEIEQLFWPDKELAKRKILWLEELPAGEPPLSGRLILSQDYVETFIFGKPVPPHFSMNFPAKLIKTGLEWDDLVISDELREQIKEIEIWVKNNDELMTKWGMKNRIRKGYRALFFGPPGTGKTLTASLLGKYAFNNGDKCGKDVYKVDLSMIVSKFIGETEKNLELLFARAEDKGWILFFDEADALFGKRTSVRDAHDKYANQEVSYLLQRIEEYNGLVILATNMKNNIDDAFIRRFNSILKFPLPDANERSHIWKRSLPGRSLFKRMADEKQLDLNKNPERNSNIDIPDIVKKYELTGGSIINVVHYASLKAINTRNTKKLVKANDIHNNGNALHQNRFSNADISSNGNDEELVIYLEDILDGIRREMIKEGKPFSV